MIAVAVARQLFASLKVLLVLTVVLGVLYPAAILGVGLGMPIRAKGSLIEVDGRVVGSSLLGQAAEGPEWFHARPSASGHAGDTSGGSNLGPSSEELASTVEDRAAALRAANPDAPAEIPPDALTASGSGLDPHISPEYAAYQAPRVAQVRGISLEEMEALIAEHTEEAALGFLGEERVNVTELNVDLATAAVSAARPGE